MAEHKALLVWELSLLLSSLSQLVTPSPASPAAAMSPSPSPSMLTEGELREYRSALLRDGRLTLQLGAAPAQLLACLANDEQAGAWRVGALGLEVQLWVAGGTGGPESLASRRVH